MSLEMRFWELKKQSVFLSTNLDIRFWQYNGRKDMDNIDNLIEKMTLEEKASLISGGDFWHTSEISRLGIKKIMFSDGPYGLRQQDQNGDHLGVNESIKTTCFPPACLSGCSFDVELMEELGERLGKEAQAHNLQVVLGPAVNIKRSPLLGRNFEYISEDPYVSGQMAASLIKGVQSQGIGTSIKHFAANNQELNRMSNSSEIDEATLNEVYLKPFEIAVKKAHPWTVMASYNQINGTFSSENHYLLTEKLRNDWGYKGLVISDWMAVVDRIKALNAGLDLEMPGDSPNNTKKIIEAIHNGDLGEGVLDEAVRHILQLVEKSVENKHHEVLDSEGDHEFAQHVAEQSIVLLKNQENILPLSENEKIAFIGGFAAQPRFQGGGSSHINYDHLTSAIDAVPQNSDVKYAKGFNNTDDVIDEELESEAIELAKRCDKAVIFAGLPDSFESEGYDRTHMELPNSQNHLINKVLEVQPNVIVVLHNGAPVTMPWKDKVKGIVEAYLGGQEVGAAENNILFGKINPSGKLAETFPLRVEDNPSFLSFGSSKRTFYGEGAFVGYRYYDKRKMEVAFPFGYGLSYTHFSYNNGKVSSTDFTDSDHLVVSIDVTNDGHRLGKEVVQLYLRLPEFDRLRPLKELRKFEKITLNPGETKTVKFTLTKEDIASYDVENHTWNPLTGDYVIMIGSSSVDIKYITTVYFENRHPLPPHFNINTTLGKLSKNPETRKWAEDKAEKFGKMTGITNGIKDENDIMSNEMVKAIFETMPLRQLVPDIVSETEMNEFIGKLNNQN